MYMYIFNPIIFHTGVINVHKQRSIIPSLASKSHLRDVLRIRCYNSTGMVKEINEILSSIHNYY